MSRSLYLPLLMMLVLLSAAAGLHGQGTDLGTIRGTVTDTSGAMIPAASVTVTDVLTGRDRVTQTNGDGYYEMFGLNPGTYKVAVTATGMSKTEITNVSIKGSDTVSANAVLKISSAQESIVVNVESAAIDTEDQTISQTLDNNAVIDLPRDSRNVYSFLYLNPNIT
jgi:carboxypeptidase family protein